jgi:hypothetical protein
MAETRNPAVRDLKGLGSRQPDPSIGKTRTKKPAFSGEPIVPGAVLPLKPV